MNNPKRKKARKVASKRLVARTENKINTEEYKIDLVETKWENGICGLDLPPITVEEFPMVSVLTITRNRPYFFALPLHNWMNFKYPHDKIEWIVVDDSEEPIISRYLPQDDKRITYYHLKSVLPIADKRNYGIKRCKGEYIVIMDDDDYHFNDSILAKIRTLKSYPEKECVVSYPLGVYDIRKNSSAIVRLRTDFYPEATMTFSKKFWKEGKFKELPDHNPSFSFWESRLDKLINVPFWFNCILITHRENRPDFLRAIKTNEYPPNFYSKLWDKPTRKLIDFIEKQIRERDKNKT